MIENLIIIKKEEILSTVYELKAHGNRFITATCVHNSNGTIDVTYHFDKELILTNVRINIVKEDEIPSISRIYFCALLVENEMKELFGVKIKDIIIDYGGHMLLSDEELGSPMLRQQITIVQEGSK